MYKEYILSLNNRLSTIDLAKLDGWRGFLAVIVMIAHANQIFIAPITGINNYSSWLFGVTAHISVLGFFVISGVVITMSLITNINKNNYLLNFKQYFLSRIARIYPPLIFSIFICAFFLVIMKTFNMLGADISYRLPEDLYVARDFFTFSFSDVLKTLSFERGGLVKVNGPLWSLIIEWWLYFIAFFFLAIFFTKKYMKLISLILFIFILIKIIKMSALIYLLVWLVEMAFFVTKNNKKTFYLILFISLFSLIYYSYSFSLISKRLDISQIPLIQFLIGMLFYSILVFFPAKSVFNFISKFSYTIYIVHYPVFLFIFSLFHNIIRNSLILNLLVIILSLFIVFTVSAYISPFIENKKKFSDMILNIVANCKNRFVQ